MLTLIPPNLYFKKDEDPENVSFLYFCYFCYFNDNYGEKLINLREILKNLFI